MQRRSTVPINNSRDFACLAQLAGSTFSKTRADVRVDVIFSHVFAPVWDFSNSNALA
jgi:hypothetical protein